MIDLEKLLGTEQFQELQDALAGNREYNYSENGLTISAKSSNGSSSIQISYEEPKNLARKEAEDFKKYLETLDDELFLDVCNSLGSETISKISNCLQTNNIESVRSGILRFKQELKQVLTDKINYYTECLNNLCK